MSDFDTLQNALTKTAEARQSEAHDCDAFLHNLYQTLRRASGPGMPLHNVGMETVIDPQQKLKPPPLGAFHAAWFRLGICEVLVRVRREQGVYYGLFGDFSHFTVKLADSETMQTLSRQFLRDLAQAYNPSEMDSALH